MSDNIIINADEFSKTVEGGDQYIPGVIPRKTVYGDAPGLVPVGDVPDVLIDMADAKEIIAHCHEWRIFPMYHQENSWAPDGFKWNQNGLGYCWTWSGTGDVMNCRARENKPMVMLSPVSMGYLVNWRNNGNYLESFLEGARKHGIAPASCVPDQHSRNPRSYSDDWEEQALKYRIAEDGVWDTNKSEMLRHCLSILQNGTSCHIAYNWWGHALSLIGLIWDESQTNNVRWVIRNSHNEDTPIEMTGRRGVPDEAFGVHATVTT